MKSKLTKCERAAVRYAEKDWKVFPLQGKKPFSGTNGFRDATTERKQIRQWWKKWPDANIGLACDSQAGPIVVDIDKDGPLERAFLERLDLPATKEATSGKKTKRHLYFDAPLNGADIARTIRPFRKNGKKIEIDILGGGGYVVAPPSIHPETGRQYRWVEKRKPASFPVALLDELKKANKSAENTNAARLPDMIDEGERDNLLTSLAGSMRRRGASPKGILAALREENETRVSPPLPDKDLQRIAKSIGNKKVPRFVLTESITDINLARYFAVIERNGLRYCQAKRKWYVWDGQRWKENVTLEVDRRLELMVRRLLKDVFKMPDHDARAVAFKGVNAYGRHGRLKDLEERARTQKQFVITTDKLDTDPWLLNVKNGTIDLRTGELSPHDPAHLITKMAPVTYDPKAKAPKWNKFLREITSAPRKKQEPKKDTPLRDFLRYAVGYSLTGVIREHALFFCFGGGGNGKTTFLETIQALLGDYAVTIDFETGFTTATAAAKHVAISPG